MEKIFQRGMICWKIPVFYLAIAIMNFGIYIPWWGLYGDDWQYLYSYHVFGSAGYPAFVAPDRPFSAWVYMLFTPLLGENIWAYHILLLTLRWISALLMFKVLKTLWPERNELAFWAGTILLIFPGFKQQPLPLEFILHFSILNTTLLSIFCMLKSTEKQEKRWKWAIPGIISALGIFSVEYFTGLDILRPVLLWVKIRKSPMTLKTRLQTVTGHWLPYLAVMIVFLYWRVFIFQFQHYKPTSAAAANPLKFLLNTGWKAVESLWLAIVQSWFFDLDLQWGLPGAFAQLLGYVLIFLLLFVMIKHIYPQIPFDPDEPRKEFLWVSGVGLSALILAGPLYWILDIPIQQQFPWDRPLLSFIPGVAILLGASVIRLAIPRYRVRILAGLCAIAIISNFYNARTYIVEWREVRDYLSQLSLRVPQVQPGTMFLSQNLPFVYYGENTFFPILNWIYQTEERTSEMRVRMFDLSIRQGKAVAQLESGSVVNQNYRSFKFASTREKVIALTYQPPACLHVLSSDEADYPNLPDWLKDLVFLSNPGLIDLDAAETSSLPHLLERQNANSSWCTYYETAELERQQQNWENIRKLADAAENQGISPQVGYEYLPFIEAFARSGEWDRVDYYLTQAKSPDAKEMDYLCSRWSKIAVSIDDEPVGIISEKFCP